MKKVVMYIDTHCHLNIMVHKNPDDMITVAQLPLIKEMIELADKQGVSTIINVGTNVVESKNSVMIARQFPSVFATVGIHPCDGTSDWRDQVREIKLLLKEREVNKIVGVGEIGLDFYHKPYDHHIQKNLIMAQIELALMYDLAIVFHVRDAGDEFLKVVEPYAKDIKRATIHCFAQNLDFAQQVVAWGFYLGIDAPITYPKNESLRHVVACISLDHLVLETDAPFLPPQTLRGKQNHPAYLPVVAQKIADIKNIALEEVARLTTQNARRLFNLVD